MSTAELRDEQGEYWIVMLNQGQINGGKLDGQPAVQINAACYDVKQHVGRGLQEGEAPEEFEDFVQEVSKDMENVNAKAVADIVEMIRNEGDHYMRDQVWIDTLVSLLNLPHDVIANMLAGMLLGCAETVLQSEFLAEDASTNGQGDID